jgi:hypothetical protein
MAFRQPTPHVPQRTYAPAEQPHVDTQFAQSLRSTDDNQEWVLFSPGTDSVTTRTHTTSTRRISRTPGRSRISDYGSLDTAARSYGFDDTELEHDDAVTEDEEDAELDSLDSHLHAFRQEPSVYRHVQDEGLKSSVNPVLPTHDGLGSFRIDESAREGVQEHLYAFERYNPRKVKRRRESLELGALELQDEKATEAERMRRIEEWRMEQSRILLSEIQKETRRRKQSMTSERRSLLDGGEEEDYATLSNIHSPSSSRDVDSSGGENESAWNRLTQRVIRDLMGIDDRLLSIIFGEELLEDDDLSTTPPAQPSKLEQSASSAMTTVRSDDTWEHRLIERIARELGLLVNQISDHAGAFSTYVATQTAPISYSGLPMIPESSRASSAQEPSLSTSPMFQPTLATLPLDIRQSSIRGHGDDTTPIASYNQHSEQETLMLQQEREHWEQDLDLKLAFRYLRSRFAGRGSAAVYTHEPAQKNDMQDTADREKRVRQHHPLVNRPRTERRNSRLSGVSGISAGVMGTTGSPRARRGSSCASQSLRSRSSSSRNYWDLGGSRGSGSLIASSGLGGWGEV